MPDFIYSARTMAGNDVAGKLAANSKREALEVLSRQSLFPLKVEDARRGQIEIKLFKPRVPDSLIASTLTQLAELLENGVSVLSAFQVLIQQTTNPTLKEILNDIHDRISDGEAVDDAFAAHPNTFNDLTISIIRAGTEGAFLEDSLKRTALFLEQQGIMRAKVIGAMIYPAVLATVGTIVVTVLVLFFVPRFEPMFLQVINNGGSLPFATVVVRIFREWMLKYGLISLGVTAFFLFWLRGQMLTPWGIKMTDRMKLKLPLIGKIMLDTAVSRFCRVLGTLLENGVPILRALDISSHSTGNAILSEAVARSAENLSSGESLSKPLAETGIFPPQIMAMITVAEESNTLENVLVNIADTVEREVSRKLEMMVRLIEPLMLLLMAGSVLFIILALMMPIFQMSSGFGA